MITYKFGGTAITPQNLCKLKELLPQNFFAVVSAVGKQHPCDTKTTDLLLAHFDGDQSAWPKVENKYRNLVLCNGVKLDIDKLLWDAKKRSKISKQYAMSLGEELSAKVVAAYLGCDYIEAEKCLRFEGSKLRYADTKHNLFAAFKGVKRGVMGGFYGGCSNRRQVFSRGGSDISGALVAVATNSVLYTNVTDVCGVCVADPKVVSGAETILNLSYGEMYALADAGAQVLHKDAVKICSKRAVPISVINYLKPFGDSTTVSNCPSGRAFLSVTERKGKCVVTTVLCNMPEKRVSQCVLKVSEALEGKHELVGYKMLNGRVEFLTKSSIVPLVYEAFNC